MTPKEIIETLQIAKAEVEWNYPLDYAIAIDEAVKIIEKEIPHKLLPVNRELIDVPYCGKCYDIMHIRQGNLKYCPNCGQKIDWSGW